MARVFPESLTKNWTEWRVPIMVLISLVFQTILILAGSRRKYSTKILLRFFLWISYLLADWTAMLSLSSISNSRSGVDDPTNPDYILKAFWASLLLLHLGGPDTITAYSLEDNELWWRNFVVLSGQVIVAFFIFLNAWSSSRLNFLSVPILVAGIIKLGQRIFVLMHASSEIFRRSMFPSPDPGPDYARYMDDYKSKRAEGFKVTSSTVDIPKAGHHIYTVPANLIIPYAKNLQDAYTFFKMFKPLFADLILSIHDIVNSQSFFQNRPCEEVFRVIEIELGFMYDVFYTKAVAIFTVIGGFLRLVSFSCVICVLVAFSTTDENRAYSGGHVPITYVLLAGATFLEIYVLLLLLRSDWTMLWLSKHKNRAVDLLYQVISSISKFSLFGNRRWSNTIGQYNLIGFCLKYKPSTCSSYLKKYVSFYDQLVFEYYYKRLRIPKELKEVIFQQLLKKSRSALEAGKNRPARTNLHPYSELSACKELCDHRGEWVLKNEECNHVLDWIVKKEFDESILLWHIATDLCFNSDMDENSNNPQLNQNSNAVRGPNSKEMSKFLSEYMLYILVMRPFMLPNGIGQIRFQDTCAEAVEFFKDRKFIADAKKKTCEALLKVNTEIPPSEVKGDRSKSVLFEACRLAKTLQSLETKPNWDKEKKWELISHVWVEILSYAASQCQRNQHAQQLRRGGELLTHVWLLMAHLGITKQFQITDGHARTKLTVQ